MKCLRLGSVLILVSCLFILLSAQSQLRVYIEEVLVVGDRHEDLLYQRPGLTVYNNDNIYITDYDNSKVYIYSPDDSLILAFGREGRSEGEIFQPMGIEAIDSDAPHNHHKDNFIVVTDKFGLRVSKFSMHGRYLGSVNNFEIGLADSKFLYIAVDYFGSIYVPIDRIFVIE